MLSSQAPSKNRRPNSSARQGTTPGTVRRPFGLGLGLGTTPGTVRRPFVQPRPTQPTQQKSRAPGVSRGALPLSPSKVVNEREPGLPIPRSGQSSRAGVSERFSLESTSAATPRHDTGSGARAIAGVGHGAGGVTGASTVGPRRTSSRNDGRRVRYFDPSDDDDDHDDNDPAWERTSAGREGRRGGSGGGSPGGGGGAVRKRALAGAHQSESDGKGEDRRGKRKRSSGSRSGSTGSGCQKKKKSPWAKKLKKPVTIDREGKLSLRDLISGHLHDGVTHQYDHQQLGQELNRLGASYAKGKKEAGSDSPSSHSLFTLTGDKGLTTEQRLALSHVRKEAPQLTRLLDDIEQSAPPGFANTIMQIRVFARKSAVGMAFHRDNIDTRWERGIYTALIEPSDTPSQLSFKKLTDVDSVSPRGPFGDDVVSIDKVNGRIVVKGPNARGDETAVAHGVEEGVGGSITAVMDWRMRRVGDGDEPTVEERRAGRQACVESLANAPPRSCPEAAHASSFVFPKKPPRTTGSQRATASNNQMVPDGKGGFEKRAKQKGQTGGKAGDVRQRKKKGRGGENAHARGGRGKKADVKLAMVTRVGKVTPKQAGFHDVRCTFIDPITGVRCGEIKPWDKKALKDLRPSGKGEWIAVVGTHQPWENGVRLHSASLAPWRKTGKAVEDGKCLVGAEGVKYLMAKNASVGIVSRHQPAYKEFLASET